MCTDKNMGSSKHSALWWKEDIIPAGILVVTTFNISISWDIIFWSGCPPRPLNNVILEIPFFLLSFSYGVFVSSGPLSKFDWVKKSFFFQILKALIHSQLLVLLFEKTKSISYFVSLLSCKNLSVSSASLFHHQGLGL